jgi:hypothetical protein
MKTFVVNLWPNATETIEDKSSLPAIDAVKSGRERCAA